MEKQRKLPIRMLILSVGPILSMLVQSLYSIIDGMFVSQISDSAFNAISLSYPIQNLILAISVGIGVGLASVIARSLGENNQTNVKKSISNSFLICLVSYIAIVILAIFLLPFFFNFFTDNTEVINYGRTYLSIIMYFSFIQIFHITIEKIFQAHNKMILPALAVVLGSVVNVILDALFIYVFKWGIAGAGVATILGQASSLIFVLIFALKYKYISLTKFKIDNILVKAILIVAIPSAIMTALPSFLTLLLNYSLKPYPDMYTNILGAYIKIQSFIYMPLSGLIQGTRPLISFNYGAKNKKELYNILKYCLLFLIVICLVGTLLLELMPTFLISLFTKDTLTINEAIPILRIIAIGFIPSALSYTFTSFCESTGYGGKSLIISLLRQLIIPVIFAGIVIFNISTNINLLWISFPVSEACAAIVSVFLFIILFRKIEKNNNAIS